MENIENIIEAIIFASGQPIAKSVICEKLPGLSYQQLAAALKVIRKKYDSQKSGIVLQEFNGKMQFSSNPIYGDMVTEALTELREKELTKTLLEVLATIAYKQPITRLEIDNMRGGTSSEYAISGLLRAGLIEAIGRKDTVGRPLLYGTTDNFLKKFELDSIKDLPDYDEVLDHLRLINDEDDALFKDHLLTDDDDDGEQGDDGDQGKTLAPEAEAFDEAASDVSVSYDAEEIFSDETPEFLKGQDYETYD